MSNTARIHAPSSYGAKNRQPEPRPENGDRTRRPESTWHGLAGLLALGVALAVAAATLGARTWQIGAGLGAALFPVEDIVELAAVSVGTMVAGWTGVHALVALACVVAGHRGGRWAAGERTVARHAPAVVRRLARVAAGAGLGLALTAPTAMAAPDWGPATATSADDGSAVVVDLGWQPTGGEVAEQAAASRPRPAPERSGLVNRSRPTGTGREPVVVEPGDTLWAIAAGRLATGQAGVGPSDAEIAAAVPQWHHANRQVLGSDPDLLHPGMVLREP